MKRLAILVSLVALSMPAFAAPVLAVVPANDTYDGRVVIGSLPFTDTLETVDATTDADDVEINAGCAPATDASVWYEFTAAADMVVAINVFDGTDYSAGVIVATGAPGSFEQVACGPEFVGFEALAGATYAILVFDDQLDGGGNGGTLTITAEQPPPPPEVSLELDPQGTLNPITEAAFITAWVTCSEPAIVDLSADLRQSIGSHTVVGGGFASADCGPEPTSVPIEVFGFTSPLNPGRVSVTLFATVCTFFCSEAVAEGTVRLRPAPEQPEEPAPPPPPPPGVENDEPSGAFPIGLDETVEQDTTGATAGADDPIDCVASPVPQSGNTVWYAFTAPDDGWYEAHTAGSDYDTVLFVLDAGGTVVACNDDAGDTTSAATFEGVAGATYLIMVGSFEGSPGGLLMLTVTSTAAPPPPPPPGEDAPPNDDRTNPVSLAVGDAVGPVDTTGATGAPDDPIPSCTAPTGHTVWYTLSVDAAGWVEVNTFGSDYDTTIVVLADGSEVACNDDAGSLQSRAVFFAEPGITYEVMIGSFSTTPGGTLFLAVTEGEPPLTVELGPDLQTTLDTRSGMVTIHGTVICSEAASVEMFGFLEQQNGRFGVFGDVFGFVEECSPDGTPFSIDVFGNEAYRPGDAFLGLDMFAFNEDEQAFTSFFEAVRLRPAGARL